MHWGAYSTPPDPLAVCRGPTYKGRGEHGRGRGDEQREEEGRAGSSSFALGRKEKSRR